MTRPSQSNTASPLHPHEPGIPPALDSEGRCRVCGLLVKLDVASDRARRAEQLAWDLAKALRPLVTEPDCDELAPLDSELDAGRKALAAFDAAVERALG